LSSYGIPSIVATTIVDCCKREFASDSRGNFDPIMPVDIKPVHIGVRSRFRVWLLRVFFKRLMGRMGRGSEERIALLRVRAAGRMPEQCSGLNLEYRIVNGVPGPMLSDSRDTSKLAILYLHGGAYRGLLALGYPPKRIVLVGRISQPLFASTPRPCHSPREALAGGSKATDRASAVDYGKSSWIPLVGTPAIKPTR